MATLTQSFLSIADVYKRTDGMGQIADIIEVLNDTSQDIMTDWLMMQCNNGTKHTHTIRTGLPSVSWGALYEGVAQSKSTTQQVDDTTGFVEGLCTIDTRLLKLSGNESAIRASESRPYLEAMAQELVTALFYHDPAANVRLPKGLGARYNRYATGGNDAGAANQVIHGGGSGSDNTSIWFVTWDEQATCAIYPKGMNAGITQEDKGEQRVTDGSGNPYYVKEELITSHIGFVVKDWRRNARIANIDVSEMLAGNVDLYSLMRKAYYKLHGRRVNKVRDQGNEGRTVIYCNRDVLEALDGLASNQLGSDNYTRLRPMEVEGKEVMSYRGMPIRETDAILNTESLVASV